MTKMLVVLLLLTASLTACSTASDYYRLEEWGDGWKLEVKDEKSRFTARWVKGDNKSVQLINYDDHRENITIINSLYLELANDGTVLQGRLKRIVANRFDKRTYEESHAQWFSVLSGRCQLDANGKGQLEVKCQGGYTFKGEVLPSDNLKQIKAQ